MSDSEGVELALVISDMGGGGAQRVLSVLANHWARLGRRLAVVTLAGEEDDFFTLDSAVRRVVIGGIGRRPGPLGRIWGNVLRIRNLRAALRRLRPKTVVGFVGTLNLLLILATRGLSLRVFISERNDPARQSLGRGWDLLRRLLYPLADGVTANSGNALRTLEAYVPKERLALVPNPLSPVVGDQRAELDGPLFLAVGRLHRQKAYDVLLRAMARLTESHPQWRLVVLGDGALRESLLAEAEALGVAGRVEWRGRVDDPFPYYRAAQVFVMPSRFEGTPNALLEAMSCGLPAVVSDTSGGALDYVVEEESGLVVRVEDAEALAAAMARLADDVALRERLGNEARRRVAACVLPEVVARWEQVLG
jgi:GalNAc-alpha-(1->4)-GalNAc-alpha-(1->3)-diNAcBac-PP-undecaprenol alpha-1,4-N-acetyl-D-galactosaminyltransferase